MKTLSLCAVIFTALLASVSCAHKSGRHGRQQQSPPTQAVSRQPRDNNVDIRENDGTKYDGAEIFKKYNSAVFMVFTSDGTSGYQGSGFFISEDGLAVSNYHVFKNTSIGAEQIKLSGSDVAYKVSEIITRSEENDFILFRVDCGKTTSIPLAKNKPEIGDKVYAIGSPRGLENTFSSGEVSQWRDTNLMQISALIDHGSSGGVLINEYGNAVGITSGSFYDGSQANLNYAWSIDVVKPFVK